MTSKFDKTLTAETFGEEKELILISVDCLECFEHWSLDGHC